MRPRVTSTRTLCLAGNLPALPWSNERQRNAPAHALHAPHGHSSAGWASPHRAATPRLPPAAWLAGTRKKNGRARLLDLGVALLQGQKLAVRGPCALFVQGVLWPDAILNEEHQLQRLPLCRVASLFEWHAWRYRWSRRRDTEQDQTHAATTQRASAQEYAEQGAAAAHAPHMRSRRRSREEAKKIFKGLQHNKKLLTFHY